MRIWSTGIVEKLSGDAAVDARHAATGYGDKALELFEFLELLVRVSLQRQNPKLGTVGHEHAVYADQALREVVRRLLGDCPGTAQLEERLDLDNLPMVSAWAMTASYLEGRIQDKPELASGPGFVRKCPRNIR